MSFEFIFYQAKAQLMVRVHKKRLNFNIESFERIMHEICLHRSEFDRKAGRV